MHIIFATLGFLSIAAGISVLAFAKSAIHEIEAFVLFLISAVLISSSAIIRGLKKIQEEMASRHPLHDADIDPTGMERYPLSSGFTTRDVVIVGSIVIVILTLLVVTNSFHSLKSFLAQLSSK